MVSSKAKAPSGLLVPTGLSFSLGNDAAALASHRPLYIPFRSVRLVPRTRRLCHSLYAEMAQ